MCAFYHKCGAFWGKINCAPFCALFGSIMCAFEFRIIRHSGRLVITALSSECLITCTLAHIGATFKGVWLFLFAYLQYKKRTFLAKIGTFSGKILKCAPFSSELLNTLMLGKVQFRLGDWAFFNSYLCFSLQKKSTSKKRLHT